MNEEFHSSTDDVKGDEKALYLSDAQITDVIAAARGHDSDIVHSILNDLSPADIAELLAKVSEDDRTELLTMYSDHLNPLVFTEMDYELRQHVLELLPAAKVAAIVSELESDDALDMLLPLDEDFRSEVIHKLSAKMRATVQEGFSYPADSAGRLMQREVVAVPHFWTVGKTIDYLREAASDLPEDFFDIFVIDPGYHVKGQIPLNSLVRAKRPAKMADLRLAETTTIPADMDQEEVAYLFRRDNITSAPVVDEDGRLLGVITIDDVVDVIDEEAEEDLLKMAGIGQVDLYSAVISTAGSRFRWLFLNLVTAIAASVVISFFDATIEQIVALAVLMPIVASMGGNAGTQALTIAVRALATREISDSNMWRIIWRETLVGSVNGVIFAVITGAITALWFQIPMLGTVIAAAMIINLFAAGFFGACIPIVLNRMGSDPAVSSTVFLTTVTDVVGFLAFLGLAALFLT
ncbi:MAG: magnesium transporter [Alphaproteobacteria bacterium]